ncbi:membrane protein [Erysipelotrichaceae bacterium]|nr:membrane protein [Erysipelotrichaceae bacterium]
MELKNLKIGLRTFKTGLSVFICILLFQLIGRGSPIIAGITAVFAMREDVGTSVKFGLQRISGNIIGAVFAVIMLFLLQITQDAFLIRLFFIPGFLMLVITICNATNSKDGIVGASATYLAILYIAPADNAVYFSLNRVLDAFIGAGISLLINYFIRNPQKNGPN